MRVLLDTNIIIDALQSREGFLEDARDILIYSADYDGYLTASSIADIFYLQRRFFRNREKATQNLLDLLKLFCIVDTTAEDCKNALRGGAPDFEDAVMVESALREGIDLVVTRNIKDFEGFSIRVCSPAEFLSLLLGQ